MHQLLAFHVSQQRPQTSDTVIREKGRPRSRVASVEINDAPGVEQEANLEGECVNLGMTREYALEHVGATPAGATAKDHRNVAGGCRFWGVCHGYGKEHLVKHITPLSSRLPTCAIDECGTRVPLLLPANSDPASGNSRP